MTKLLFAYSLAQCFTDGAFVASELLKAMLLAGFTWWLYGFSLWLWNRDFKMRFIHHVFCAFAAATTLVSIFLFQCLGEVRKHALIDLKNWQAAYISDNAFGWRTFLQAHDKLQQIYQQNGWTWDSNKYLEPPRDMPSNPREYVLPLDQPEACEASLKIYCDRAIENLALNQSVLSQILWKKTQISLDPLRKDLSDFQHDSPGGIYEFTLGSLRIAGDLCLEKLGRDVAEQVLHLRLALIALFLFAQFITFGLAGYSAYSALDIKN